MTGLELSVVKQLDGFDIDIDLTVGAEIVVLFGRSGVGKTRLLECVAGLDRPDRGRISLNGELLFQRGAARRSVWVPARRRGIGYVVQEGALFPHLSVLENVRFALRKERAGSEERARRLLEEFAIAHLAERSIDRISGGQIRRVAIARALAASERLLLLDEPFVHLDRMVRAKLQDDLVAFVHRRRIPTLLVTHDVDVAARVADRIAVIDDGRVVQLGSVEELLFRPTSSEVARLLGDVTVIHGQVEGVEQGLWTVRTGETTWRVPHLRPLETGAAVELVVRAGAVKIVHPDHALPAELAWNRRRARIERIDQRPDAVWIRFSLGSDLTLLALVPPDRFTHRPCAPGDVCEITVDPAGFNLFSS